MKSSSKIIRAAQSPGSPRAWQPADFRSLEAEEAAKAPEAVDPFVPAAFEPAFEACDSEPVLSRSGEGRGTSGAKGSACADPAAFSGVKGSACADSAAFSGVKGSACADSAIVETVQPPASWKAFGREGGEAVFTSLPVAPAAPAPRGGKTIQPWQPADLRPLDRDRMMNAGQPAGPSVEAMLSAQAALEEAEQAAAALLSQARAQEAEILLQAQRAADEMIAEARQEIENARQAAYQQGQAAAREDVWQDAQTFLQAAHQVVEEVHAWQASLVQQSLPDLLSIAREIAGKMFGEGVVLDNHALQQNLNRLLTNAKILGDINIYLNPRDAETLDSGWREIRSKIAGNRIQIVPSDTVIPGGCFIEGQLGAVDARVETQLKAALDVLTPQPSSQEAQP